HPDDAVRGANQRRLELLTPVVKGWCTEAAQGVTWNGIQVHGGMGFIEETGACQHMRDARITTIYEGTTAIQANDLIGRKVAREGGHAMRALLEDMATTRRQLDGHDDAQMRHIGAALGCGMYALTEATEWLLSNYEAHPQAAAAGAVPFLKLAGTVAGGWLMARSALVAFERLRDADDGFYAAKLITARYFAEHVLPEANSYRDAIVNGSESVLAMHEALF
uniref:acyl-CoA dehydrogenase C-terminal domain-containing protein n=1 Tax=Denitromonas sp. TaxID=2734609 RepID=UPI002CD0537E|nr:acyl-CoA dehydrogenase [Denitromonas sp.]HQV16594.1 acyl-CoA dehydrogenase [Denitromonas sp.]